MAHMLLTRWQALLAATLVGCAAPAEVDGGVDAARDLGRTDLGPRDAGSDLGPLVDQGSAVDLGAPDAGALDAARADGGEELGAWTLLEDLPEGCIIERATQLEGLWEPTWEACDSVTPGCRRMQLDPGWQRNIDDTSPMVDYADGRYLAVVQRQLLQSGQSQMMRGIVEVERGAVAFWRADEFGPRGRQCELSSIRIGEPGMAVQAFFADGVDGRPFRYWAILGAIDVVQRQTRLTHTLPGGTTAGSLLGEFALGDGFAVGAPSSGAVLTALWSGGELREVAGAATPGTKYPYCVWDSEVFWVQSDREIRRVRMPQTTQSVLHTVPTGTIIDSLTTDGVNVAWLESARLPAPSQLMLAPYPTASSTLSPRVLAQLGEDAWGLRIFSGYVAIKPIAGPDGIWRYTLLRISDGVALTLALPRGSRMPSMVLGISRGEIWFRTDTLYRVPIEAFR